MAVERPAIHDPFDTKFAAAKFLELTNQPNAEPPKADGFDPTLFDRVITTMGEYGAYMAMPLEERKQLRVALRLSTEEKAILRQETAKAEVKELKSANLDPNDAGRIWKHQDTWLRFNDATQLQQQSGSLRPLFVAPKEI